MPIFSLGDILVVYFFFWRYHLVIYFFFWGDTWGQIDWYKTLWDWYKTPYVLKSEEHNENILWQCHFLRILIVLSNSDLISWRKDMKKKMFISTV